jgi:hypothetical protein
MRVKFARIIAIVCAASALPVPAFAGSGSAPEVNQSRANLIQQLQRARQSDWQSANDPYVSPIRQGTFLNQMNKAERVIEELDHGFTPAQSEIDDALWAPPKHISPEERAHLIEQLKLARAQDDRNEQEMLSDLAWSRSSAPADTALFDGQKQQVDQVIKDLEIGAPVRWSAIKAALVVPTSPY